MVKKSSHASDINIKLDARDFYRVLNMVQHSTPEELRFAMIRSMQQIGLIAVSQFMVAARVVNYETGQTVGTTGSKLNIRTERLSRSLVEGFSFAQGLSGEKESIRDVTWQGRTLLGLYGTKVPYAAIHEHGGEIPISKKARGYFWHRFKESGKRDTMWKALALKKGVIKVPPRPYLHPAVRVGEPAVYSIFNTTLRSIIRRAEGGK